MQTSVFLKATGKTRLNESRTAQLDVAAPHFYTERRSDAWGSISPADIIKYNLNGPGDTPDTATGYEVAVSTMTYIIRDVTEQKYYTVVPSDYLPVVAGEGQYADELVQTLTYQSGGDFESGIVNTASHGARLDDLEVMSAPLRVQTRLWTKAITYSLFDIEKALRANNCDMIAAKTRAMKKFFDQGMQFIAFLGSKVDPSVQGLLTTTAANINLTTITQSITSMTPVELNAFVAQVILDYSNNCGWTAMPDTFLIPASDYVGLPTATSPDLPIIDKLNYMLNAFKVATGNDKFEIKRLAYCDAIHNADYGIGEQIYVLYRNDVDSIKMNVNIPFTLRTAGTINNFEWNQLAFAQFTGVVVPRPLEILQFRYTP